MNSSSRSYPNKQPLPRIEVANLKAYSAPLEGRRNLLRLDFNENTIGPSPKVVNALKEISNSQIAIYPEYEGLKEAFIANLNFHNSKSFPLENSQIGIFNGVDAAIHAIFHAYGAKGNKIVTTSPTFGYYTPCAQMQGMEQINFPYEGESFRFPIEKIRKSLIEYQPKLLLICNPNNPTGTRLDAREIINLANNSPTTLIVVDELYEAFTGDSVLPIVNLSKSRNIVILRSLSKTAGLAGLRIGFAISNQEVIDYITRVVGPYDVNAFAVKAAFAALEDQKYIDNYVQEILKARDWIQHKLISHNIKHHIAGGNYLLIWPKKGAKKIQSLLKAKGILIRDMSGKELLEGSIRVSIGTQIQMERFWQSFIEEENSSN